MSKKLTSPALPPRPEPLRGDLARLLTVEDAAAMLQVDPRTIRRLVQRGELAAIRIGRLVRIEPGALRVFVSNCGQ
ncbi:helix-turn-helix domain-containing protein [Alsobacter sp. SYSU BS001988]